MRGRILRRLGVAALGPVLDMGTGYGAVVPELVRRSRGPVLALDRSPKSFKDPEVFAGALPVRGDGTALPFPDELFALVHVQLVFMWQTFAAPLAGEIARVLRPGGTLLAVEPDYGGLVEWPNSIAARTLWESALERAGADPRVGRKLPSLFESLGLRIRIDLPNVPSSPDPDRFDLLQTLPLSDPEQKLLADCRKQDRALKAEEKFVHLPVFFISATKPVQPDLQTH